MNKKIYIEILWSTILDLLSTQIPYYQFRNLVSQLTPEMLPRWTLVFITEIIHRKFIYGSS